MENISQEVVHKTLALLNSEVVPAEGCTEPIAIAYAAAKATELLGKKPEKINISISGNIIKNVKSVVVPNSGGMVGIAVAAAMGAYAGDPSKELLVISDVTDEQRGAVKDFLSKNTVCIKKSSSKLRLYIYVEVLAGEESAAIEMRRRHTNITKVVKNDIVISEIIEGEENASEEDVNFLSMRMIYDMAVGIDIALISELFDKVIKLNTAIAEEGLKNNYGVNTGRNIQHSIESGFYGSDVRNRAVSFVTAGSDARMGGCAMPVMTTAGSGNVGMSASLPVIFYCRDRKKTQEQLYRALFFSHLATVYIKSSIGRLSAYCGPMCAAAGVAGAIGLVNDYDYDVISKSVVNVLSGVSGVVCDGANSSCAMKIAIAIYSAYDAIAMAVNGNVVPDGDGIVGYDVESTIANIGEMARVGMQETDEVILDIMTREK